MAEKKSKEVLNWDTANLPKPTVSPSSQIEEDMIGQVLVPIAAHVMSPGMGGSGATRNRYVLQHAHFYPPAERLKHYRKGRRKNCWGNSQLLAMGHAELTYVEGFAFSGPNSLALEHAWCVTGDGRVVDTTWAEPGAVYYGVPFDRVTLMKHLEKTGGAKGELRPIMEPDFFDPNVEWSGGRTFGPKKSKD